MAVAELGFTSRLPVAAVMKKFCLRFKGHTTSSFPNTATALFPMFVKIPRPG